MKVISSVCECPSDMKQSVIALGNFDGVHKGHQQIIQTACALAKENQAPSAVMTFEPHPIQCLGKDVVPFRLMNARQKQQHFEQLGIDVCFEIPFTMDFSKVTASAFVDDILCRDLSVCHVVIGYDFIFGCDRQGNAEFLKSKAKAHGFKVTQLQAFGNGDQIYSSSKARDALRQGQVKSAYDILGHGMVYEGEVIPNQGKGTEIGFPTLNIALGDYIRPRYGVYAVQVHVDDEMLSGVANIGVRPTLDGTTEWLEVHLLNVKRNLYGKTVAVELIDFIREEKTFASLEELQAQITLDVNQATLILCNTESSL